MMKYNLEQEAASLKEFWSPRVLGRINDQFIKVAKLKGDLAWHKHDDEDELFMILSGSLRIEYETHSVDLDKGDFHIVPRNTMHNPVCTEECLIALIEPASTKHTGDVVIDKTKSITEQLIQLDK